MNSTYSKKILTLLVVLLLIANAVTLSLFWFKKEQAPTRMIGGPAKFIIKELGFDEKQQEKFLILVQAHQNAIRPVRDELRQAKDDFFDLLHNPKTTASKKLAAVKTISSFTEKIDLITLDHFAQVREMCNPTQQEKFDAIIKQVTQMMGMPHPPVGGPPKGDLPPNLPAGEMPPPHPDN